MKSFCHSRESGNPGFIAIHWIPDQVGNDRKIFCYLNDNFE